MSDDNSSEISEEEEPRFKYHRIGGVSDFLNKDTAASIAVSDRFLGLGTHGGLV